MDVQDEEIKLEFLVSGSYDALPSSYLKLRSYLNIHSSNLANLHCLSLPECFTKKNLSCLQCRLPWSCETSSIKLLPVKKHKKKFSKNSVESSKVDPSLKVPRNHLVLKCRVCNSRSHFYIPKNNKILKTDAQEENKIEKKNKKKKKKKDKLCGLRKCLNTSLPKSPTGSINKTKSPASKPNKAANSSTKKVQQVNVKNSKLVPQSATEKIQQVVRSKKPCINPHAAKLQHKTSKKDIKNLKKLQQAVQRQKEPLKKTLRDFLTVI